MWIQNEGSWYYENERISASLGDEKWENTCNVAYEKFGNVAWPMYRRNQIEILLFV